MGKFREWLREAECKKNVNGETVKEETEYQKFFSKKLEKFGVSSPAELSDEDKKKFYDEIDAEWEGEKEEPEADDVNEAKNIVNEKQIKLLIDFTKKVDGSLNKKQLDWFAKLILETGTIDELFDDLSLMIKL